MLKLETVDVSNINIANAGKWKDVNLFEKDFDEAINNFNNGEAEPFVGLDHNPALTKSTQDFFKAMGLGYVSKLWRNGKKLMANFKQVPKLIAELIDSGALKQRSIEFWKKFRHADGRVLNNVLEAVTLHGGNGLPAINTLEDIPKIFKDYVDEYKIKSVEQTDLVRFTIPLEEENLKEEKNIMEDVKLSPEEYKKLMADASQVEKFKMDVDNKDEQIGSLQNERKENKEEISKLKKDNDNVIKLKADMDKRDAEATSKEANDFVDDAIKEKKLQPKFKELKVEEYITLKNSDADKFELFKEELESRGEIIGEERVSDSDPMAPTTFKSDFEKPGDDQKDWDNADKLIKTQMKKQGYNGEEGYMKAGVELNIFHKSEIQTGGAE